MASKVHGGGQIGTIILQGPPAFSRGNNDTANLIEKDPKAKSKAINPGCMEMQALRIQKGSTLEQKPTFYPEIPKNLMCGKCEFCEKWDFENMNLWEK